tara:strand:- start:32267 stop:32743 length:477 start_codon:yes stop_codon:yes gene_type:complete
MILLDKKRIERTLKRMSYQILEEAHDHTIHLAGINERGMAVAAKIQTFLENASGKKIPLSAITSKNDTPVQLPKKADDELLVIIDDVIFSGGTVFNSMMNIRNLSEFKNIIVSVLVDRGHRKYPVLASIVGFHHPTKFNEHVSLQIEDKQPISVQLTK